MQQQTTYTEPEQFEDYGDYQGDEDYEDIPSGGVNNDQWPQSLFMPNGSAPYSALAPEPAPEDAPLRRVARAPEPVITHTEFRDLIQPTSQQRAAPSGSNAARHSEVTREVAGPTTPTRPSTAVQGQAQAQAQMPYTPYDRKINDKEASKPKLEDQSPPSTSLVEISGKGYRKHIVTKDGFPNRKDRDTRISQLVATNSLGTEKGERRLKRYKADKLYRLDVDKLIKRLGSQVRGSLVKFLRDTVGPGFNLIGLTKGQIIVVVTELVDTNSYHFRDLTREKEIKDGVEVEKKDGKILVREFAYRHPLIAQAIRKEYFQDHERMGSSDAEDNAFNPIPNATIALVATAIACALSEWRTGVHRAGKTHFRENDFKSLYADHLKALDDMTAAQPDQNIAWRRWLFTTCSSGLLDDASGPAGSVTLTQTELTDYSDIPV